MAQLAAVSAVVGIIGTVVSAVGTIASGNAARADAEFQAVQLEQNAKQQRAAAQAEQQEIKRRQTLATSRAQTVAAGSGLGADDPTVREIQSETNEYGGKLQLAALAAGRQRANQALNTATAARASGKAQQTGSLFSAIGQGFAGAARFTSSFDKGGFGAAGPLFTPYTNSQSRSIRESQYIGGFG
jgi:hypothetical protein